jgi:hypothetical protein
MRKLFVCVAALMLLAACGKSDDQDKEVHMAMPPPVNTVVGMPAAFAPPPDMVVETRSPNVFFSLRHALTLTMAHDAVAARYQAARDACLKDKTLNCTLVAASFSSSLSVNAVLQVALPHDKVAEFEKRLLKPLPQDGNGKVEVTTRNTTTENQTEAAGDTERQLAQATAYRDSLEQLAKRPNLTVDEVLKIHHALDEAQSAVETAMAAKRATQSSIRLEQMDITFEEELLQPKTSAFDGFWQNAHDVLMSSTAVMLLRLVNALPWLPLALLLAWIVARFVGRVRRKPRADG